MADPGTPGRASPAAVPGPSPSPSLSPTRTLPAVLAAGLAAALAAWQAPWAALVVPAAAVLVAVALAATRWPGRLVVALLGLVVAQDALVGAGLGWAQQADEVAIAVLVLATAWRQRRAEQVERGAPWDAPLLGFVVVAAVGAAWRTVPPLVAGLGILAVTKGALAGAAVARIPLTADGARRAADGAAALVAASGLVAVVQRLGGEAAFLATGQAAHLAIWHGAKAPGLFAHHNALAHASVLAGAWWLGRRAAGVPAGPAVRAAELATLGGLIASASREGWVAAIVGMAAVAALWPLARGAAVSAVAGGAAAASAAGTAALQRARRRRGGRWALLALAGIVVAAGLVTYASSPVLRAELMRRAAGVPAGWHDFELGLDDWAFRGEYRVYALRKSLAVWADHPLLGAGAGRFGGAVAERFGSPIYEAYAFLPLDGRLAPLDVFWARLPAEFGLLGAVAFVLLAAAGVRTMARARRADDAVLRALAIGGFGAWAAACVLAAFAPSFEDPLVSIPLWLWTAAVWRLGLAGRAVPR